MSNGLPSMAIVGLADKAVAGSKEGAHFNLPVAMGLLVVMGVLPSNCLNEHISLGELALVARTIADLAASPTITRYHVLEALPYRRFFLFGANNG